MEKVWRILSSTCCVGHYALIATLHIITSASHDLLNWNGNLKSIHAWVGHEMFSRQSSALCYFYSRTKVKIISHVQKFRKISCYWGWVYYWYFNTQSLVWIWFFTYVVLLINSLTTLKLQYSSSLGYLYKKFKLQQRFFRLLVDFNKKHYLSVFTSKKKIKSY